MLICMLLLIPLIPLTPPWDIQFVNCMLGIKMLMTDGGQLRQAFPNIPPRKASSGHTHAHTVLGEPGSQSGGLNQGLVLCQGSPR